MEEKIHLIYCTKCISPNTRPNSFFHEDGVCSACRFADENAFVDRRRRFQELEKLLELSRKGSAVWDSVVGVSGGKDSTRQAMWVREKLGRTPLLVNVVYPPRQLSEVGAANISNLIALGFDCEHVFPAPQTSRRLFRESFLRFGNAFVASEMVLFAAVQRIALERDIPIVFWGENAALQVGDKATLGQSVWDGNYLRDSNTLAGGDISWMVEAIGPDVNLSQYRYPSREDLRGAVDTVFLGPAWDDWFSSVNSTFSLLHGFSGTHLEPLQSGDLFQTEMVDEPFFAVNHWLKYIKYGFGRGTDQANQLIRLGAISREEGARIAMEMDPVLNPSQLDDFLHYVNLDLAEWKFLLQKFTNPFLFDLEDGILTSLFVPGENAEIGRADLVKNDL